MTSAQTLLGELVRDDAYDRALLAWCSYYTRTELFDRALPGTWSPHDRDAWIPATEWKGASVGHALLLDKETRRALRELEVPEETSQRARERASAMSYTAQVRLLSQNPDRPAPDGEGNQGG